MLGQKRPEGDLFDMEVLKAGKREFAGKKEMVNAAPRSLVDFTINSSESLSVSPEQIVSPMEVDMDSQRGAGLMDIDSGGQMTDVALAGEFTDIEVDAQNFVDSEFEGTDLIALEKLKAPQKELNVSMDSDFTF